jgi:hypothetical protein
VAGATALVHVQFHEALGEEAEHVGDDVGGTGLLKQFATLHAVRAHRVLLRQVKCRNPYLTGVVR